MTYTSVHFPLFDNPPATITSPVKNSPPPFRSETPHRWAKRVKFEKNRKVQQVHPQTQPRLPRPLLILSLLHRQTSPPGIPRAPYLMYSTMPTTWLPAVRHRPEFPFQALHEILAAQGTLGSFMGETPTISTLRDRMRYSGHNKTCKASHAMNLSGYPTGVQKYGWCARKQGEAGAGRARAVEFAG